MRFFPTSMPSLSGNEIGAFLSEGSSRGTMAPNAAFLSFAALLPAGICGRYAHDWERLTGDPCGVVK